MPSSSTQSNIPIAGIKDGIMILRDGQYRIVLEIAAVNFELKSEQEQNSIIFQYQSFLNSLHFPIQIVIQSKKLDLSPYLKKIKELANKQTNELIQIQTTDYVDFVEQLINLANIMKKRFYVTVGYQPVIVNNGIFDKIFHKSESNHLKISETDFINYAKELRQRAQNVAQGLGGIGLHCRQLSTQEIIELFYEIYNPEVAGKERLTDTGNVSGNYITQLKPEEPDKKEPESLTIDDVTTADEVIDNRDLVAAQHQQKSREISAENAKKGQEKEPETVLPGESAPSSNAKAPGVMPVVGQNPTNPGLESGNRGFDQAPQKVGNSAAPAPSQPSDSNNKYGY